MRTAHPTRRDDNPGRPGRLRKILPPSLVFMVASVLLTWNLDVRYLWQDEAATALLAQRLLEQGRPLGYDGVNLVTMDRYLAGEESALPTGSAEKNVRFHVERGDFKSDTAWIGQPWGQFVVAGLSLSLFGPDTFAARLPFALAGALLAALLFVMVRGRFGSTSPAVVAVLLLLGNSFWFLHIRQCRYYALSSLFLLLTMECYFRWQEGRRWWGPVFVCVCLLSFHMDFGTIWAVLAVLAVASLSVKRRPVRETVVVFTAVVAAIAPFVFYYELLGRLKETEAPLVGKLWGMFFQLNQFQLPLVLVLLAAWCLYRARGDEQGREGRHVVILSISIIGVMTVWMSLSGPFPFYRYLVPITALSAMVSAYAINSLVQRVAPVKSGVWLAPVMTVSVVAIVALTTLPSWAGSRLVPVEHRLSHYMKDVVRPELQGYMGDLGGVGGDPNRAAVEFLRERLSPDDEILCNYEDVPLMFYLSNPVRGGIGCFRVEDRTGTPRFAVIRKSIGFGHMGIYNRELRGHAWRPHVLDGPDIPWGNNPDPRFHYSLFSAHDLKPLVAYERVQDDAR